MSYYSRHVHLDFHSSELVRIGEHFDPDKFARTLTEAKVNSIVVFAKCHHGWCYYPTKVGHMHPGLRFDLMGEQIKACKKAGIRVIAYITGAWSASDAVRHPSWQGVRFATGNPMYAFHGADTDKLPPEPDAPMPDCYWAHLCLAGEYGEHIKELAREVLERYDVDGLFFDIMGLNFPCVCSHCVAKMQADGYDREDLSEVLAFTVKERQRLLGELRDIVKAKDERLTVFFNSGGASVDQPEYMEYSTHFEMENLASSSSLGYDGIANRSKYFREKNKPVYGMTGKFHTSWGEFGGFKHPDALVQECAAMIAYGVHCNVGDQLHPSGEINKATYEIIGKAFDYVEKLEDYIDCGRTVSKLGLLLSGHRATREGYAKLLMDSHVDYGVLMPDMSNLGRFACVMLTAPQELTAEQEAALCDFYDHGGKLILLGAIKGADRLLAKMGYKDLTASEYDVDYTRYRDAELPDSPILMYQSAHRFSMEGKVLATVEEPYFSRTDAHYFSHRNTPNRGKEATYPAIVLGRDALCFAHNFGESYFMYGNYWHREIFKKALLQIYTPDVEFQGLPAFGRYTYYQREGERLLHVLGINPIKRGSVSVLEEAVEIFNVGIRAYGAPVKRVVLKPQNTELPFVQGAGYVELVLPRLKGHQLIVLEE